MKTKIKRKDVLNILCLEDSPKDAEIMRELLTDAGYVINADCTDKEKEFVSLLRSKKYNLILSDFKLPGFDGFTALKWSVEICPEVPFICVSGTVGEEIAVELLKNGAVDYVLKTQLEKLPIVIERALNEVKEKKALRDAEETILKERNLLRTIIDNLPVGIFVKDKEYKKIIANPVHLKEVEGHLKYLGKNSEIDILGKTDFDIFPKKLAEEFFTDDHKVIQDGYSLMNIEGIGFNEKAAQLNILVSKIPLRENNGEIIGMVGVATDITERKLAEEILHESEKKFRRLFENSLMGISLATPDGQLIQANSAYVRMYGYECLEKMQTELNDVTQLYANPEDRKEVIRILAGEGFMKPKEIELVRRDGTHFFVLVSVQGVKDADGNLIYNQASHIDITDRKLAEDALHISEERFRSLYNNSTIGLYRTTPDGKIILANPALVNMLGYSAFDELASRNLERDGFEPSYERKQFIAQIERDGEVKGLEEAWKRKDGSIVYIRESARVIKDASGKTLYYDGNVEDITERKIAEEKLKFSNALLSTQQEASIDGILVVDGVGKIISFNKRFLEMWEVSRELLENNSEESILEKVMNKVGDTNSFLKQVKYLNEHNKETSRDDIVFKDGKTFDRYSAPMFGSDDKYYGRVWYFRDITERTRAEEEKEKERTLLKTLIDNLPSAVFVKDKDLKKIIANKLHVSSMAGHLSKLGLDPGIDIIGKTDFEVYPEEAAEKYFADDQKIILHGESIINKEEEGIGPGGKKIQMLVSKIPLCDKNGMINGMIGITTDITDLKKVEEALKSEQYLLQALMNNIPDNIYFKDRESRYIRINKSHAQLFGLKDPLQAVGMTDFDFFTKEHAQQAYNDEQEIICTGQPINKEEKETWPDRPDTWVYSTKLPLPDKEGNIIGTFGISMDITVLKETELMLTQKNQEIEMQNEEYLALNDELEQTNKELIVAKEKAEESDKLKTSFLQNMSHEIRTPMNGILGFAELLKNPKLPEVKQQEFIKIIEKSGQRMLNIISDIVNISKIETGQIELDIKETNVNDILKHLHNFFGPDAEKKNLKLDFKTGLSDDLCKIETDEVKLTQVLSNLLNNALKFTKAGTIEFGYKLKGKVLEFYIRDTGIGIGPENLDIIFERFRQADMSVTRNFEGAGLGLSISKAYVEKLNGKIWVKSELDKGSTFFFSIPYNPKVIVNVETPQEAGLEDNLSGIHILIAEDDRFCMELLKEVLEEEKAILFLANDGKEALDMVKSVPEIQLVLMDLKMPVMNGFESTKLIKKLKPGLPVIAQSAYAFSNDQDKAKMAGCDDFIGKPLKRELLLSKIHKYISKK
jgi:PAS domain S-box-containing protein